MKSIDEGTAIVVGAGPAGLMAAINAALSGTRVIVYEQQAEAGIKLLATGGGRCNFTNTLATEDFIRRFGVKARFVTPALRAMDGNSLRRFFEELGVPSNSPDGFHVFPVSDSARSIRNVLMQVCRKLRVEFRFNSRIRALRVTRGKVGAVVASDIMEPATRVILAPGGASYPALGGGPNGYELARGVGHGIVPLCPALAPLITRETWPSRMAGLTLPRVSIAFLLKSGARAVATGGLLFTHKGVTGPVALDISGVVSSFLATGESMNITLDLSPGINSEGWQRNIAQMRKGRGGSTVLSWLGAVFPVALARMVLDLAGVSPVVKISQLLREQCRKLVAKIKNLPLNIVGTEGFGRAMITRGGVKLDEVNQKTLESKLARGLFFAGEILDIDGPCGGFNLQWAFSSGKISGCFKRKEGYLVDKIKL